MIKGYANEYEFCRVCHDKFVGDLEEKYINFLEDIYEKLRLEFCKTGTKTFEMEQIGQELGVRGAKEWFEKHPPNLDPNFRWTDANRWDKD